MTSTAMPAPQPAPSPPPPDVAHSVAYRLYRGTEELRGMMEANHRLRTRCGILEPIDMASMEHRYSHLVNSDPLTDCMVATRNGETVGYGRVEWHDLADGDRLYDHTLVVAPDAWGLGIMSTLLAWCEARLLQVAAGHTDGRRGWFGTFLSDGDDESRAAIAGAGYELARLGADMLRPDLDDLPPVDVPSGYTLRTPSDGELPTVHASLVEAFREHWGETEDSAEAGLAEWVEDPRFDLALVAVLWDGEQPASCSAGVLEHQDDGTIRGYVSVVGTHPGHRRRGLARTTLTEVLHRLRAAGATSAYLEVDAQNQNRAFALYEELGFRKMAGSTAWRKPLPAGEGPLA
jgi:ribosomal protein S18 acetylase RimI-like enzyme